MKHTGHKTNGHSPAKALRSDLESLQEDTLDLAREIQLSSQAAVNEGLDQLRKAGEEEVAKLEKRIAKKPLPTVLMAFTVGLFTSLIFASRRSR